MWSSFSWDHLSSGKPSSHFFLLFNPLSLLCHVRYWQRTAALSVIIAVLTITPVFQVSISRLPTRRLDQLFADIVLRSEWSGDAEFWARIHVLSVFCGAWAATLVTKLDWKQVWQEYPVPSVTGALSGSLLSHATYMTLVTGRRLLLSANY